jgi:hypothetical protein
MNVVILSLFMLLCITIFFVYDNNSKSITEHYDASIENVSLEKCTLACKISRDCKGFGYDKNKNICYPSKNTIDGKILGQLYSNKYKKNNIRCNKFSVSPMNNEIPNKRDRRDNSLFICTKNDFSDENMFYHYDDKLVQVAKPSSFDQIDNVDYYKMKNFTWPRNKYERKVTEEKIENDAKEFSRENTEDNKEKEINIKKNTVEETILEIEDVREEKKKVMQMQAQSQLSGIKKSNYYPKNIYEVSPLININNNLLRYGCVDNIDLNTCLKGCSKDNKCMGVEWNPLYLKLIKDDIYKQYKNVCCLKNNMDNLGERDTSFKSGNSYVKQNKIDPDKKYHVF